MIDDPSGDRPSAKDRTTPPSSEQGPLPVPELAPSDVSGSSGPVSDEDRTRYGILLDRAAERGLLAPYDYEIRLRELASATTIDQMNRIVTELPVFTAATEPALADKTGRPGSMVTSRGGLSTARGAKRRGTPWLTLAILVIVVVASLVVLSLYAHHLLRNRNSGLPVPVPAQFLSGLHL